MKNPFVPKDKLRGSSSLYKIKLRSSGYRLVYDIVDNELVVYVLKVGKRENNDVYDDLESRF